MENLKKVQTAIKAVCKKRKMRGATPNEVCSYLSRLKEYYYKNDATMKNFISKLIEKEK